MRTICLRGIPKGGIDLANWAVVMDSARQQVSHCLALARVAGLDREDWLRHGDFVSGLTRRG